MRTLSLLAVLGMIAASQAHATDVSSGSLSAAGALSSSSSSAGAVSGSKSSATGVGIGTGGAGGTGTGTGGSASVSDGGDDVRASAWGFSYTRNPIHVPQATVSEEVAVTSTGIELGPLFSYSSQTVEFLPAGIVALAAVIHAATTNDGTYAGERAQFSFIAALCAKDDDAAYQAGIACK